MMQALEELPLLHTRSYDSRVYLDGDTMKVVGSVRDVKPPGLYIDDDPEPLEIHHMQVMLDVSVADLRITDAVVEFRTHPHHSCPSIVQHYDKLIGLNVTRGFNRKVRQLFGGPKACTHTTALLQAMAPVITQALWSMRVHEQRAMGTNPFARTDGDSSPAAEANLNTCHIWAEDGEHMARIRAGERLEVPVWIERRFAELGRSVEDWMATAD